MHSANGIDSMLATIATPFDGAIKLWEATLQKHLTRVDATGQRIGEAQARRLTAVAAGDGEAAARCKREMQQARAGHEEAQLAVSEARSVLTNLTRLRYEWRAVRWVAGNGK